MKKIGFLIIAAWLVLSCRTTDTLGRWLVSPTPTATNTPRPTFTLTPSPTATVTSTLTPTSTPRPSLTSTKRPAPATVKPTVKPVATAVPGFVRLPVHKIPGLPSEIDIVQATPVKGKLYCQVNHLEFVVNLPSDPTSYLGNQDKRNVYFYVRDGATGDLRLDLPVIVSWPGESAKVQWEGPLYDTWLRDRALHPSLKYTWLGADPGSYNGDFYLSYNSYGPDGHSVKVGGDAVSDKVVGVGVNKDGKPGSVVVQWICQLVN